jgi:hypothetical protein
VGEGKNIRMCLTQRRDARNEKSEKRSRAETGNGLNNKGKNILAQRRRGAEKGKKTEDDGKRDRDHCG